MQNSCWQINEKASDTQEIVIKSIKLEDHVFCKVLN